MKQASTDEYWDEYYKQGRDFISVTTQEIVQILSYVPKTAPRTALDIGCGTGQLSRELQHRKFQVLGIDISNTALEIARSFSATSSTKLRYIHHNVERQKLEDLPFSPYGLITCQSVYAFIEDKENFLSRVDDALAPEGIFALISPLNEHVPNHKKTTAVDSAETHRNLEKHFEVIYYEKMRLGYFICTSKR